ncbi:hypothetical protein DES39_0525 [Orbus hercynius]|uniref:Uncharacterized protein n=1 Tax=Orbus hercynius TaxID=593135 RepID=A0A495RIQ8_9GAMM|nr:hypothetical protein [Orbus hercynius]RKS87305.1 hypothetical protein DES39_0525 [Orbus hercynius]
MTKLTPLNIKIEQLAFEFSLEEKIALEFGDKANEAKAVLFRKTKKGLYVEKEVKKLFRAWLKKIELARSNDD